MYAKEVFLDSFKRFQAVVSEIWPDTSNVYFAQTLRGYSAAYHPEYPQMLHKKDSVINYDWVSKKWSCFGPLAKSPNIG